MLVQHVFGSRQLGAAPVVGLCSVSCKSICFFRIDIHIGRLYLIFVFGPVSTNTLITYFFPYSGKLPQCGRKRKEMIDFVDFFVLLLLKYT